MTRDMELVRAILLYLEKHWTPENIHVSAFEGRDEREVRHHLALLRDAGYIKLTLYHDRGKVGHGSLTWEGYEFLDAARNETVWGKVVASLKDAGGTVPVEILKALLIEGAKRWGMDAVFGSGSSGQ